MYIDDSVSNVIIFSLFPELQKKQQLIYEEQKKLVQQQAQTKAQMARYEDELARKRMQVFVSR
jgi:hypothetical protein